jgi:excinuclease ABC subunit C
LYFLQRLRDEAHRFAISTHRAGRSKNIRQSELDEIAGIGAARKRALLNHFGSARGVKMAGLADLEAAPGISHETARRVYAHFHPGVRMENASHGPRPHQRDAATPNHSSFGEASLDNDSLPSITNDG